MTKGLIKCPACGTEMVTEYAGGKKKLRSKIIVWGSEGCIGKCRKCGTDVPLDLQLVVSGQHKTRKKLKYVVISD